MTHRFTSFADGLRERLDLLEVRFQAVLDRSAIHNIDPNTPGSGVVFLGAPEWGWVKDESLEADRTHLLRDVNEWFDLFVLLHRSPLPETERRIERCIDRLRVWLDRSSDSTVPSTVAKASEIAASLFDELRSLIDLATTGPPDLLAVPDTNVLLKRPAAESYAETLGADTYTVVLIPTVLQELDELKDRGRTADVREAASRAVKRIKGYRDRGNLQDGVKVAGNVSLRAEHREVRCSDVLDWLDPAVPDDRILAAALDLQGRNPASALVLVTGDVNLQNKAAAVAMAFVEPE